MGKNGFNHDQYGGRGFERFSLTLVDVPKHMLEGQFVNGLDRTFELSF